MPKFEKITKYAEEDFSLPTRKTQYSAGYDFVAVEDILVPSHARQIFEMVVACLNDNPEVFQKLAETTSIKNMNILQNETLRAMLSPQAVEMIIQKAIVEFLEIFHVAFTYELEPLAELVKTAKAKLTLIPTGVKVYLEDDQYLQISVRSSTPFKYHMMLANGVGIIDKDYVDNPDNEGHIMFQVINLSPFDIQIKKGDVIGQGIICKYYTTDNDAADGVRVGGLGSTTSK